MPRGGPRGGGGGGGVVGSRQGQAFIYERSDLRGADPNVPADNYLKYMQRQAELAAQPDPNRAAQEERYAKTLDKLGEVTWFKDQQDQMQPEVDKAYDMLSELRAAGIADPMTSARPEARMVQQQVRDAIQMGRMSSQLQERHKEVMNDIAARKGDNAYTPEYLAAVDDYFSGFNLRERMKNPVPEPQPTVQRPAHNQFQLDLETATKYRDKNLTGQQRRQLAASTLNDPETATNIRSRKAQMTPEQLASHEEMAKDQGYESVEVMLRDQDLAGVLFNDPEEPYDVRGAIKSHMPGMSSSEVEDDEVTITWMGYSDPQKENFANVMAADPRFVEEAYRAGYLGRDELTPEQQVKAAHDHVLDYMNMQGSRSGTSLDEPRADPTSATGRAQAERAAAFGRFEDAFRSGDMEQVDEVANYLTNLTLPDGSYVEEAYLVPRDTFTGPGPGGGDRPAAAPRYAIALRKKRRKKGADGTDKWETLPVQFIEPDATTEELGLMYTGGYKARDDQRHFGQTDQTGFNAGTNAAGGGGGGGGGGGTTTGAGLPDLPTESTPTVADPALFDETFN